MLSQALHTYFLNIFYGFSSQIPSAVPIKLSRNVLIEIWEKDCSLIMNLTGLQT